MHLASCVDEVLGQSDVRRSLGAAPHLPIAGASTVSMLNEKLRMDLLFLDVLIAFRVMDVFSRYSLLIPASPKKPKGSWDASRSARIGMLGQPGG